jgi:hypothetical protein
MFFKFINRHQHIPVLFFTLFLIIIVSALSWLFYQQITCDGCSIKSINPSSYLMPIIAYLSIGFVGVTIRFTRKTASEKNALDFAKELRDQAPHIKVMTELRKGLLLKNGNLNRRLASAYMESLSDLNAPTSSVPKPEAQPTEEKSDSSIKPSNKAQQKPGTSTEKVEENPALASTAEADWKNRTAACALLNSLESCANAIRYGIYDEDFIYNLYGSHFIEWYELTYGLIKTRQLKQERIWVNFEWLAVKWTLRRNITGVISEESKETSHIINESLEALKTHKKIKPITRKLKQFEGKLERRKFPM